MISVYLETERYVSYRDQRELQVTGFSISNAVILPSGDRVLYLKCCNPSLQCFLTQMIKEPSYSLPLFENLRFPRNWEPDFVDIRKPVR